MSPSSGSSDEALKNCGYGCVGGGGSGDPPPTPTSGSTCPGVNGLCHSAQMSWSQFSADQQQLMSDGCNDPIDWETPGVGEYLALCPRTAAVNNWVAAHPGAEEVYACDACLPAPGRFSVWVRLTPPWTVTCGVHPGWWCYPNCPSGCADKIW